jgi:hypothetical protein
MGPIEAELRAGGTWDPINNPRPWREMSPGCQELLFSCAASLLTNVVGDPRTMPDILSEAIECAETNGL